jgi:hypothetical protein
MASFESYAKRFIVAALDRTPREVAPDVYVVSLYVEEGDDSRTPTVWIGFNTQARVADTAPAAAGPGGGVASDADEARWNYAFWLQNALGVLGDPDKDPEGAALSERWLRDLGLWYSDEDEDADFEAAMEQAERIDERFVDLLISITTQLHDDGTVTRIFGRPIPVLIHELEYYDAIAERNRRANPNGLAEDFARWIDDMYVEG